MLHTNNNAFQRILPLMANFRAFNVVNNQFPGYHCAAVYKYQVRWVIVLPLQASRRVHIDTL